jgi:hypothetical protein
MPDVKNDHTFFAFIILFEKTFMLITTNKI